ncbi:MAG: hypothetical protein JXR77_00515 [Lentisphaeria bacterium]|nr:hypothetical protein [Lentisphaeria bacterium]
MKRFAAMLVLLLSAILDSTGGEGEWFSAPGPNLARGKGYTWKPAPGYSHCTDGGDAVQLTDGVYTSGYFWTQAGTVGWTRAVPVTLTLDLGAVEPVAGASFHTAAGVAGVIWPFLILVLVSDDGQAWYRAGELVAETIRSRPPPAEGYAVHRFAAAGWRTRGRYVRFMVGQTPYCFVDEIEVYGGDPEWLAAPRQDKPFTDEATIREELFVRPQVALALEWRLRHDLDAVAAAIEGSPLEAAAKARLLGRAGEMKTRIDALPEPPVALRTVLPFPGLHEEILALHAPVLRARGLPRLTLWHANRWEALHLLDFPAAVPPEPPTLDITMMRGEVRGDVLNLTNAGDTPLGVTLSCRGLPGGDPPEYANLLEVLHTDTRDRVPVAAALVPARREGGRWSVTVPAGCVRQVWLSLDRPPAELPSGDYAATLRVEAEGMPASEVSLTFRLVEADFPTETTLALGGWDYTNGAAAYYRAPGNLDSLLALLRDCYVNTPWATSAVAPRGMEFDAAGALVNPEALDCRAWDEWVERWAGARNYFVFLSVGRAFREEPAGTPRFGRMVGDWFRAWAAHASGQGVEPSRVGVLLVDEPHDPGQDEVIIAWARAIRAAGTGIRIFEDPTYRDPTQGSPEMFALCDILCPNTPMLMAEGEPFRNFYLDQQARGRTLWLYSCSGPAKRLDPCGYHRGQMWWALRLGALGCHYWALGCGGGIGDSWRAYAQSGVEYAPFFVGQHEVARGKHMEAVREGVQDYETFVMLRRRVEAARAAGRAPDLVARAASLLEEGPRRVTATLTPKATAWAGAADHAVMDAVRCEALRLLEALGEP